MFACTWCYLKLNSTEDVALSINSTNMFFWNEWLGIRLFVEGFQKDFDGFIKETLVNKLDTSKEHIEAL